jgi:hypothetical protein
MGFLQQTDFTDEDVISGIDMRLKVCRGHYGGRGVNKRLVYIMNEGLKIYTRYVIPSCTHSMSNSGVTKGSVVVTQTRGITRQNSVRVWDKERHETVVASQRNIPIVGPGKVGHVRDNMVIPRTDRNVLVSDKTV